MTGRVVDELISTNPQQDRCNLPAPGWAAGDGLHLLRLRSDMTDHHKLRVLVPLLNSFAGGCPEIPAWFQAASATDDIELHDYRPGVLLAERWDIVYIYWPEWCVRRDHGLGVTAFDSARFLAELQIAKLRGAKVVWHANNVVAHEVDRLGLIDMFFRTFALLVDQLIGFTQTVVDEFVRHYPVLRGADQQVIPIGDYRDFYPNEDVSREQARETLGLPPEPTIGLALGMIRPYKNAKALIRCYVETAENRDDTLLLIAGKPVPVSLGDRLRHAARDRKDVRLDLGFVPDDMLQYYIRAADFAIVPTQLATTSGSALLALSFDRPVLLPHRAEYIEWQELLGPDWVLTYEGGLRASVLARAYDAIRPSGRPPLEKYFDWSRSSEQLLEVLRELVRGPAVQERGRGVDPAQ